MAAFILFFALSGLLSNILLLYVFVLHWRNFFKSQLFTFFVLNMIIAGIIYSATNLWASVPCTINKCMFISSDSMMIAMTTPNTVGHWGYLLSSAALTIYRFGIYVSKTFDGRKRLIKVFINKKQSITKL
ncbi:unnamed protein product [Strongylus vulgaris]|uniref:G-protein coupled receptors family 1 profile domain-containing protein n=1 Tax=Strongylus vulgaris TaxID=40348 RepID=A0A3P7JY81_STRVU|nr:unnamed protein product [Strongylus vulgaris]